MNHLFIIRLQTDTNVSGTDFKEFYPSINLSMDWNTVAPYAIKATEKYLKPYLGSYYDVLYNKVKDEGDNMTEPFKRLIGLLKFALANYTVYDMMPHINTVISDMGVMENANNMSNKTSNPVQPWRYKNTRWNAMIEADSMMDIALEYLYDNLTSFTGFVPQYYSKLVPNTHVLQQYANISGRRAYLKMGVYLREAENDVKCMMNDAYTAFETKVMAKTLNTAESALYELIKRYISDFAMEKAVSRLSILVDGDGLKLLSSTDAFNLRSNALTSFGPEGAKAMRRELNLDVMKRKNDVMNYLLTHKEDFPLWVSPDQGSVPMVIAGTDCIGGIGIL